MANDTGAILRVLRIALLVVVTASSVARLHADESVVQPPASHIVDPNDATTDATTDAAVISLTDLTPADLTPATVRDTADDCIPCDEAVVCDPCDEPVEPPLVQFGDWLGYNAATDSTTWVAGGDFGMTSLESFPTLDPDSESGLTFGTGFHFLSGPIGAADLPPRLFDFRMAYHVRKPLTDATTLDLKLGVGAFSDFQTSARKGVRFPGHIVVHTAVHDRLASVFGVDVLDRDDISLLPVAGVIWRPADDLIVDFVFPRPKVQLRLDDERIMYFGGELGGGTWAVRRDDRTRDNVTYRDLRVTCGISSTDDDSESVLEIGWAFDRELTYRSRSGNTNFDGAFILRWQTNY